MDVTNTYINAICHKGNVDLKNYQQNKIEKIYSWFIPWTLDQCCTSISNCFLASFHIFWFCSIVIERIEKAKPNETKQNKTNRKGTRVCALVAATDDLNTFLLACVLIRVGVCWSV